MKWLTLSIGILLLAASATVTKPRLREAQPALLNPQLTDTLLKSQKALLLELYWLRVLNAIAESESEAHNRSLYAYAKNLSTIDRRFYQVYFYLGANIAVQVEGKYFLAAEAEEILRKGIEQFPNDRRLYGLLGFTLFAIEKKYAEAAEVFHTLSTFPDAPAHAAPFATRLLAQSGNTNLALELAQQLADSATDDTTKKEYEKRVAEIKVEAQLQTIDKAITTFKTREGRPPIDLAELVSKGDYFGTLTDAQGGTISIGKDGRAATSGAPRRLEIYERDE
jgi:hypothetical protein